MKHINGAELRRIQNENPEITIIDVRTGGEVENGKIPGSKHMDIYHPDFVPQIQALDRSTPYCMVCHSGGRSSSAAGAMIQWGFEKVYNLSGGMMCWDGELE